MVSSGKTAPCAPHAAARLEKSRILRALPERSPTVVLICASAIRMRSPIVTGGEGASRPGDGYHSLNDNVRSLLTRQIREQMARYRVQEIACSEKGVELGRDVLPQLRGTHRNFGSQLN